MPNPARAAEASALLARLADQSEAPKYIRAYHGSPYDFDRFDASKIGTGEGAQAYGHGLYFAGRDDVAESYRQKLTPDAMVPHTPEEKAELLWRYSVGKADVKGAVLQTLINDQNAFGIDNRAAIEYAKSLPSDFVPPPPSPPPRLGRVYEVELGHPESALLDWDRPLKSQGAFVGERLAPFRTDRYDLDPKAGTDLETGATALHRIAAAFDDDMGEASAALFKAGIPGIKYWDAGSRSAHKGTRNYVIFPGAEDSIRILRKYAVPGAIGTGAAAMQEQ